MGPGGAPRFAFLFRVSRFAFHVATAPSPSFFPIAVDGPLPLMFPESPSSTGHENYPAHALSFAHNRADKNDCTPNGNRAGDVLPLRVEWQGSLLVGRLAVFAAPLEHGRTGRLAEELREVAVAREARALDDRAKVSHLFCESKIGEMF